MTRLLFPKTKSDTSSSMKPKVSLDKKGYVIVTPMKKTPSPPEKVPPLPPKVGSSPSLLYENFTPLRAELFHEKRSLSEPATMSSSGQTTGDLSQQSSSAVRKPGKPARHSYVNCKVSPDRKIELEDSSGEYPDRFFLK